MNTNNTKFTFNKKSFALSLACVSMLATAGNAYHVTGATDGTASSITVTSSTSVVIAADKADKNNTNKDLTIKWASGQSGTVMLNKGANGLGSLTLGDSTQGILGDVTLNESLSKLIFGGTIAKSVKVNANIGTIGAADKDITVSGGTTGINIADKVTVDKILGKDFTVSGSASIKGIENSGTIGNIAFTGKTGISGSGTIGISNTSTGTINGITFGGKVEANKDGILINNEGTITGGIACAGTFHVGAIAGRLQFLT